MSLSKMNRRKQFLLSGLLGLAVLLGVVGLLATPEPASAAYCIDVCCESSAQCPAGMWCNATGVCCL